MLHVVAIHLQTEVAHPLGGKLQHQKQEEVLQVVPHPANPGVEREPEVHPVDVALTKVVTVLLQQVAVVLPV
jgi:hypothetical protein